MGEGSANEVVIRAVRPEDQAGWLALWQGYHAFYNNVPTGEITATTWARLLDPAEPMEALVAERNGALAGMTNIVFHRNTWMLAPVCYLQDLFTAPEQRGLGIGQALIEAVYARAEAAGSPRVYWLTHETNAAARVLYDKVATRSGFIQYRKQIG